jgi:hypothetical protein
MCAATLQAADSAFVTYRQLMTPLGTTASQHGTTVGGLHANAKAVSLGAMTIIRLERTFWHSESCFLFLLSVGAATNFAARVGKSAKTHCG